MCSSRLILPHRYFPLHGTTFLLPWSSMQRIEKTSGHFGQRYYNQITDPTGRIKVWLPLKVEAHLFRFAKPSLRT